MANMRKYAGSRFLKLEDVLEHPRREKVAEVTDEGRFGKPILRFESGAQLSLNATNVGTLIKDFGEDSASWLGAELMVYAGKTKYQGDLIDAVLVRPATTPAPASRPKPAAAKPKADFDDDISDTIPY